MSNKTIAIDIFKDALEASLPKNFISKYCKLDDAVLSVAEDKYDLNAYKNIYVFGSGKAAFTMAKEIEKLLGEKIHKGLIVAPKTQEKLKYIEVCEGSHPIPDEKSFSATKKLLEMMQECESDDFYIYLLSGGSSSLTELPVEPIDLADFQTATKLMLHNGLEIQEINSVRKHISQVKGGRLAHSCRASGVVLVISDIIGDDLYSIGSAPMYADKSSYAQAKEILECKNILTLMPQSIQEVLQKGVNGLIKETPKEPKKSVKHYMIASNRQALNAAAKSAEAKGFTTRVIQEPMQGNVNAMLELFLEVIDKYDEECILFGGECTVNVTGDGQGGRNQHMSALMLQKICEKDLNICFLSAGTDGIDGNSDAAGAVATNAECSQVDAQMIQKHIERFDSYNLFKQTDGLIITGPSGTNVIDIAIIIKRR